MKKLLKTVMLFFALAAAPGIKAQQYSTNKASLQLSWVTIDGKKDTATNTAVVTLDSKTRQLSFSAPVAAFIIKGRPSLQSLLITSILKAEQYPAIEFKANSTTPINLGKDVVNNRTEFRGKLGIHGGGDLNKSHYASITVKNGKATVFFQQEITAQHVGISGKYYFDGKFGNTFTLTLNAADMELVK